MVLTLLFTCGLRVSGVARLHNVISTDYSCTAAAAVAAFITEEVCLVYQL